MTLSDPEPESVEASRLDTGAYHAEGSASRTRPARATAPAFLHARFIDRHPGMAEPRSFRLTPCATCRENPIRILASGWSCAFENGEANLHGESPMSMRLLATMMLTASGSAFAQVTNDVLFVPAALPTLANIALIALPVALAAAAGWAIRRNRRK
jgi:hypothetical protein